MRLYLFQRGIYSYIQSPKAILLNIHNYIRMYPYKYAQRFCNMHRLIYWILPHCYSGKFNFSSNTSGTLKASLLGAAFLNPSPFRSSG